MKYSDDYLNSELKKYFGFNSYKGSQKEIIHSVLAEKDTFVLMPTGGGKSLCYQLPALIMEGTAIIISPLIALMKNQVDAVRGFTEEGIAHFLNSSLNKAQIQKVKDDIISKKTKMLYVAPESLTKAENIQFLQQIKISFYAIDEAHCISEWGHDFRPEYRRLREIISQTGNSHIIALTATATPKVQLDIRKNLDMMEARLFKASFNRANLYYVVKPKIDTIREMVKFIKANEGKSGIVYCLSRKKVEEVAKLLSINGIKSLPYHAGLDASTRGENQDKFLMEDADVIVATIAFGMGIDKPDVRYVIHYDIPKSLEGYYQETGRAGRDGGEGLCVMFYNRKDVLKLEKFIQGKPVAEQEIGKQLLWETAAYAESAVCRRKQLLHYFGEEYNEENCNNCDNCLEPTETFDGSDYIMKSLLLIQELKGMYKGEHIVNIIMGNKTNDVKIFKHDKLKLFGFAKKDSSFSWLTAIRQALMEGLIYREIENYGILSLTSLGEEYINNPYPILVHKDRDYTASSDDISSGVPRGGGAADNELLTLLKQERKSVSRKINLPSFVIFQDPSLEDMATQYPITIDELKNCQGVGEGKARKYGQSFVDLIKVYVEENEIDRPQDMVVKSIVNRSGIKVYIIQSIDKKISLEDISIAKDLEYNDLLEEIEAIVNSGTKLNLDYYLDEIIDEDKQDDIYDYFKNEAISESLDDAIEELGSDYSEEEVRLVRLKFMSDLAN